MNLKDTLIYFRKQGEIDFKDITKNVVFINDEVTHYYIIFSNQSKFHVQCQNVRIYHKTSQLILDDYIIRINNILQQDIKNIDVYESDSDTIYKVYLKNGFSYNLKSSAVHLYSYNDQDKSILNYWKHCACESNLKEIADILYNQYQQLDMQPNGVLYSYMHKLNAHYNDKDSILCPFDFNNSQLSAINNALNNKISIIKGPPGTGKTQTILNIICNLIVRGKTIGVVSSNNTAIANIENKLKNYGYGDILACLGNGDRKDEFFANVQSTTSKATTIICNQLSKENLNQLAALFKQNNTSKKLEEEINAITLEKQYYEQFNKDNIIDVSTFKFKTSQQLLSYLTSYQNDTNERTVSFLLSLKLLLKYGPKKSLINITNRNQIITSLEYKYYELKIKELTNQKNNIDIELKKYNLNELKTKYRNLSKAYLDNYINANIHFESTFNRATYKYLFADFIKRYPIITSTAISFMSSIESAFMFDYIIVDEASQVTIPQIIPLLNKCTNIIIVGDDKQLPPIERYSAKIDGDIVYNANIESLMTSFMKIYPNHITTLLEHYRCNPAIIGFCNQKYYSNTLIPFTKNNESKPLQIYFTSSDNHMRKITDGQETGIYNQREIDIINEVVNNELSNENRDNIGIISPYRLQTNKLQNQFPDIECDTIHRFQGREKSIILFSSVLDNSATNNDIAFVDNANMLNVTVSRAIDKFILVTNEDAFATKGKEIHDLINYMAYKTMNANLYKNKCVSIFDYLYKSKEKERKKLLKNSSSKSLYYSEKLLKTLLDKITGETDYKQFSIQEQVLIKDISYRHSYFSQEEYKYIVNGCSIDFLIKDQVNQDIVCAIEVDGVSFHENNKVQQYKDSLKNSILSKCNIPLLRLSTNGSNEEEKIRDIFNKYLNKFNL